MPQGVVPVHRHRHAFGRHIICGRCERQTDDQRSAIDVVTVDNIDATEREKGPARGWVGCSHIAGVGLEEVGLANWPEIDVAAGEKDEGLEDKTGGEEAEGSVVSEWFSHI